MKNAMQMLSTLFILFLALSGCQKEALSGELTLADNTIGRAQAGDEFVDVDKSFSFSAPGAVYVMDNDASGNHLLVLNRAANGTLGEYTSYATGGNGTGGGLGSQGSILVDAQFVFICNAGSNDISVFRKGGQGLTLVDRVDSRGIMPISLTYSHRNLYVVNAGGTGNISGFLVAPNGKLAYLNGSTQALSSTASGPAQISFNRSGNQLIVTEKATNMISTYPINPSNGIAGPGSFHPSAGQTPFGFDFDRSDNLIVSEAFGGASNASAVSSYGQGSSTVNLIDGPVATNQTAACWVAVAKKGQYAYATNTGSASVTGYRVHFDGSLELLNANGITATTGTSPIDVAVNKSSSYLYVTNAGTNSISMFAIENDGSLTSLGEVTGLPDAVVGMAAE